MKRAILLITLVLALVPQVLMAAAVRNPDSPFGVIAPWDGIKDAGVKWIRCGAGCTALDWGAIEKERGVFDWENADKEVDNALNREGADLLPILGYTPKWASSGPNGENAYPPQDIKDWSDFVYRVVDRYKGKVKYWEVWNEEDIGFFKGTTEQYVELLKSAYVAAKKADPDCQIVFGGMAGVNLPFLEAVYQNGGRYYFDVMAVHPYQWGDTFNDAWFSLELRNLHALMAKNGDAGKEIWITEFGWSTGDKAITEGIQARLLAQGFITALTLGDIHLTKAFWFCVKDWGGSDYGLIADDGTRKPAFNALRWVADTFTGTQYIRPLEHEGLRCHFFRKNGKLMLAVWSPDKQVRQLLLPEGVRWTTVQKVMGPVQTLNESKVSIGPEPLVICSDTPVPAPQKPVVKPVASPYKLDVWFSVRVPEGTSRLYVVRGESTQVKAQIHNDSDKPVEVELTGRVGRFSGESGSVHLDAGESKLVSIPISLPAQFVPGLNTLTISGRVGERDLAPSVLKVRVSDGDCIEFNANSTIESRYMFEDKGSGGAPSVRFNGTWTYKFDLSQARGGKLDLHVGAHEAREWRVLLSSDQKTWTTALSGKSTRSWHSVDLTPYSGGPLFVKFEGNDQQLGELILTKAR